MSNFFFIHLFLLTLVAFGCQDQPATTTETAVANAAVPATDIALPSAEATILDEPTQIATKPAANQPATKPAIETANLAAPKKAVEAPTKPIETAVVEKATQLAPTPSVEKPVEAQPEPRPVAEQPKAQPVEVADPPSHDAWDKLLRQYVTADGKVNYDGFKNDKAKLEAYLKMLDANPPQDSWSRGEKMAFWINAYNAATVKLIVDNYPLASITKLDGGKPWDVKRVKIGSKTYSLNNIENDILRPQFKDARIHFAVNCAAQSCPPLLNRAWTASNLEGNFEKQARAFINNPKFNKISAKSAQVSNIFEWYAADFGNLIDFLNKYATTKIAAGTKVGYVEYDWGLNQQ